MLCWNLSYIAKTTSFLSSDGSVRLTQPEAEPRILNYRTIVKLDVAGLYSILELLFESSIKGAFFRTELLTVYENSNRLNT